eukprot:12428825-Karenia_brevis.AAC.1
MEQCKEKQAALSRLRKDMLARGAYEQAKASLRATAKPTEIELQLRKMIRKKWKSMSLTERGKYLRTVPEAKPRNALHEVGVKNYMHKEWKQTLEDITALHPESSYEERKLWARQLCRKNFRLLPASKQWEYAQVSAMPELCPVVHGAGGKFARQGDEGPSRQPSLGIRVVVHSLVSRPDLNGKIAVVNKQLAEIG